jgi:hypothetical protein
MRFQTEKSSKVCPLRFFIEGFLCDNEFVTRSAYLIEGAYAENDRVADYYNKIKVYYQPEWFMEQTATWNSKYKPVFTETLTRRAFGFTFNMLSESKLFTEE